MNNFQRKRVDIDRALQVSIEMEEIDDDEYPAVKHDEL